jgi:DNA-binding GntR family transcriptional regulator
VDEDRGPDLTESLRSAILRGEYAFGSRLKIDEIARRYGVSHMPVRKALHQLAGERLVTAERNRGASVRSIDITSVRNIYDVVIPLESLLTRRATERMDAATEARLAAVERRFERAARALDAEASAELNREFHEIIGDHAGNPDASHIVNRYQELLRAFRRVYGFDAGRLPGVIADHRSLLASFAAGDADGAAAIAAGHAAKARNSLIAAIRGPDGARADSENDNENDIEETPT